MDILTSTVKYTHETFIYAYFQEHITGTRVQPYALRRSIARVSLIRITLLASSIITADR